MTLLNEYDYSDIDDYVGEMYSCFESESDELILTCALALAASVNISLGFNLKKINNLFKESENAHLEYLIENSLKERGLK